MHTRYSDSWGEWLQHTFCNYFLITFSHILLFWFSDLRHFLVAFFQLISADDQEQGEVEKNLESTETVNDEGDSASREEGAEEKDGETTADKEPKKPLTPKEIRGENKGY